MMKKEHELVISRYCGVAPVKINAALVCAQNRVRNYWFNWGMEASGFFGDMHSIIPQPKDRGIVLRDILQKDVGDKYYISQKALDRIARGNWSTAKVNPDKTGCLGTTNNSGQLGVDSGTTLIIDVEGFPKNNQDKAGCLTGGGHSGGNHSDMDLICVAMRGREAVLSPKRTEYGKEIRKQYEAGEIKEQRKNIQQLEPRTDEKTNTLTSVQKDNLVYTKNYIQWDASGNGYNSQQDRAFYEDNKCGTIPSHSAESKVNVLLNSDSESRIRRLTEIECERLQGVPDLYTNHVSSTRRYHMLGNGWQCDVIEYLFSFLKPEVEEYLKQEISSL